ncbi:Apoptosis inhibitor 5 [Hypsibius exemplaris]|uniref:Apoptosis inhibitor 5 n=1 Tax=Hypsibius exemplaris TaxID=2072580 RepID=A0A1W0WE66_HYPEX|nr:Apoptosis inhibitor 5 [Hypsibius exemplaris]
MAVKADDHVGNLYNYYMVIDGAENKSEHRDKYLAILAAVNVTDNAGARKLAADFIGRLFKFYPEEGERSIQALAQLCVDSDAAIKKSATETLVELCKVNATYVKRVADLLIQMFALAEPQSQESKGVQACLVKLLHIEPRQALEGLLDQIVTAQDVIRAPAIRFLKAKLGELPASANNTEIATLLIGEYKKILPDCSTEEFENLVGSLSAMKFFQTLHGGQMLVDVLVECMGTATPYTSLSAEQAERLITCCRLALPCFSRVIQSTKLVEYFCDHVIPTLSADTTDQEVLVLQVFAELCASTGDLKNYQANLGLVLQKLIELLPAAPTDPATFVEVQEQSLSKIKFSAIECLLCAFHLLGKRHQQFLGEPEQAASLALLKTKLQYLSSCMQLYGQKIQTLKLSGTDAEAIKKSEVTRRVITNIKSLILDLFHTPPHFKDSVHLSWKKDSSPSSLISEKQSGLGAGKIATRRKIGEVSNGNGAAAATTAATGGKIRTKYEPGTGRGAAAAAARSQRAKITTGSAPAADVAKLQARAERFGASLGSASNNDGTSRFIKTKKI